MKSAKCENCGANATPGATGCSYCGTAFVVAAPGVASPAGHDPEVLRLLREGNKIGAIKVYRELHRCDRLGAKNAVEAIERALAGGR